MNQKAPSRVTHIERFKYMLNAKNNHRSHGETRVWRIILEDFSPLEIVEENELPRLEVMILLWEVERIFQFFSKSFIKLRRTHPAYALSDPTSAEDHLNEK